MTPRPVQRAGREQGRAADGRWRPGQSGNARGRQRGARNRTTLEVLALADALLDDPAYLDNLKARIMAGRAPALELYLWGMRFGRPRAEGAAAPDDAAAMRALGDDVAARLAALAARLATSGENPSI